MLTLNCPSCGWAEDCDTARMRHWLKSAGALRRATDPEPALVAELFRAAVGKFACPDCESVLQVERRDDAENWPSQRACEGCGKTIPRERLAAIPAAALCAACQEKVDRGEAVGEAEYCPYCGGIMVLRKAAHGVTRYVERCGDCGR